MLHRGGRTLDTHRHHESTALAGMMLHPRLTPHRGSRHMVATMAPDKSQLVNNLNHLLSRSAQENGAQPAALDGRLSVSHTAAGVAPGQPWLPGASARASAAPGSNGYGSHASVSPQAQPSGVVDTEQGTSLPAEPIYRPVLPGPGQPPVPLGPALLASTDMDDYHPSDGWKPRPHHLSRPALWARIRQEAEMDANMEPALATFMHSVILSHSALEGAMAFLLATKLADGVMLGSVQLMSLIRSVYEADPDILEAACADMHAVLDRDPACHKFVQCMVHYKGFQAVQAHRISNFLWRQGRQTLAVALSVRVSELFAVDIHPAATIGRGVMLDHATGIVIGETAVVGDNVSMLHHVSLGGSGIGRNVRHPHVGHGVLIGAGVAVLGPVRIGPGCKIGAGSVVVADLPAHVVAVGVPARIVKRGLRDEPVKLMDSCSDFILDYVI